MRIVADTPYLPRYLSARPDSIIVSPAGAIVYGHAFGRRAPGGFDAEAAARRALDATAGDVGASTGLVVPGATGVRRGEIAAWSPKSRRRLVRCLIDLVPAILAAQVVDAVAFVSLTYGRDAARFGVTPVASKRDFDAWMTQWLAREHPGAALVWVWEVQKRGAPHFHCLIFLEGVLGETFAEWVTESWIDITGLGGSAQDARREYAADVRPLDEDQMIALGVVQYLVKELAKSASKARQVFPAGVRPGRFWGVRNDARLDELREAHPPAPLLQLHADSVPVVADRLRAISTARIPDGLCYHYAERRGESPPGFWRVGFDHLGVPGRYLEGGEPDALSTIIRASRRHHCGRYGANRLELWHRGPDGRTLRDAIRVGEVGGHFGIPPAQRDFFSVTGDEVLAAWRRDDFGACAAFYPGAGELLDRYPHAAPGQLSMF